MSTQSITTQLRLKVKEELWDLKQSAYPKFHQMKQSKEGYKKAEELIIEYAIHNQVPISTAIAHLEAEL